MTLALSQGAPKLPTIDRRVAALEAAVLEVLTNAELSYEAKIAALARVVGKELGELISRELKQGGM